VGKRSLSLKDTVNAKMRWTTIYCRVNKFLKKSHIVIRFVKRVSFFKMNDINDISFFGTSDCHHFCSNSMLVVSVSLLFNIFYRHIKLSLESHTYIPLTLYPRRGSREISDILWGNYELAMRNTVDVTGGKPIAVLLQCIRRKCY
jgi:hypothetical protein